MFSVQHDISSVILRKTNKRIVSFAKRVSTIEHHGYHAEKMFLLANGKIYEK